MHVIALCPSVSVESIKVPYVWVAVSMRSFVGGISPFMEDRELAKS